VTTTRLQPQVKVNRPGQGGPAAASAQPVPEEVRRQVLNRLNRAYGQLGALIRAVESGTECRAVITQLSAVSAAVDRAGFAIVASGMKQCLAPAANGSNGPSIQELEKMFMMLA